MKLGWGRGIFSPELSQIKITDAIGKNIICEDGIERRCVEICYSNKWPWKAIINEQDSNSNLGHFVNLFSLSAQILEKPLPSKEAQEAFCKMAQVRFNIQDDGSFQRPPEKQNHGLWLPPKVHE